MQVDIEALEELRKEKSKIDNLSATIGNMEIQKQQLISNILFTRTQLEQKIKEYMSNCGVSEKDMPDCRINLENGEIENTKHN